MTMTTARRRGAALAAAVLSAALALTACGSDNDDSAAKTTSAATSGSASVATSATTSGTHQVKADNGTITVPVNPQRVVTIGNTGEPFLDLGGKPVGVTEIRASQLSLMPADQKATYDAATLLSTSGGDVDLEKLASVKPDLIVAQFPDDEFKKIEKQLESIAPTVFFGLDAEWKTLADSLADATGLTGTLDKQKADFDGLLTKFKTEYSDIVKNDKFVDVSRYDSSDPGTFVIADIGCSEIARDDVGLNLPKAADGADPLAYTALPFEQLSSLTKYDVITYPVDAQGQPTKPFAPVVATNTWKALPNVTSGHALGVFCPGNNSYGDAVQYLTSLDSALAKLPKTG